VPVTILPGDEWRTAGIVPALETLVTRRERPLFEQDFAARRNIIADALYRRRILVIGGGGSIGSATTRLLSHFSPASLHVIDQSENYLAELVRDLRGSSEGLGDVDLRTFPIDYASPITERLLAETKPYDAVLNFAALKHVRSEKDVYSLLQMIKTNIVGHRRFKEQLQRYGHGRYYFAVSTDKAANPTSLMGASKRLMEDVAFGIATTHAESTASARFANVAFSNGSLLQGFLRRLERRQPLAVPRETQRYFVSHQEAAQLCVLAAFALPDRHIAFPRLDPRSELQSLQEITVRLLDRFGYVAVFFDDEESARLEVESLAQRGRWPVLLTPLDTSGEKPYEEFVGGDESEADLDLCTIAAVHHRPSGAIQCGLLERLEQAIADPTVDVNKSDIVGQFAHILPNFHHTETGRNLDQRL
jgi:nucleoside-diphosphate-sugar epimerase